MLSGDNEGLQTQEGLPQFSFQSSQLPLLLLTASLQSLNLVAENEMGGKKRNKKEKHGKLQGALQIFPTTHLFPLFFFL